MNRLFARMLSCFIRDKRKRHAVRALLLSKPGHAHAPELKEELEKNLSRQTGVSSLRECVAYYKKIEDILSVLTPYSVVGVPKIRVGGNGDGGYVMLNPGRRAGVAYSLGVSEHSPWDLDMASRGYDVYQFDGTIGAPPDIHPNLHFERVNIVSPENDDQGKGKSLERIFRELRHETENEIVLQMDIEGGEWEVLRDAPESTLKKFRQIIIELHDLTPRALNFSDKLAVLRKIARTHKPVHVHFNNCAYGHPEKDELPFYSSFWEVTYARAGDYAFEPCAESFPTPLDSPNLDGIPDIAIGHWDE